jgi:hypothetical protein
LHWKPHTVVPRKKFSDSWWTSNNFLKLIIPPRSCSSWFGFKILDRIRDKDKKRIGLCLPQIGKYLGYQAVRHTTHIIWKTHQNFSYMQNLIGLFLVHVKMHVFFILFGIYLYWRQIYHKHVVNMKPLEIDSLVNMFKDTRVRVYVYLNMF